MNTPRARLLLDTSVVIQPPAGGFRTLADTVTISAVTLGELAYGVDAGTDPMTSFRRRQRLQMTADAIDVLPFGRAEAEIYGVLAGIVRNAGRNPRPRRFDLLIAATAVSHELPLATRNVDDFRHLERAVTVVGVQD